MSQESDVTTWSLPIDSHVEPKNLSGTIVDPYKSGAGPQQAGLSGPVFTLQQNNFAFLHRDVNASQDREGPGNCHYVCKLDDRRHFSDVTTLPTRHHKGCSHGTLKWGQQRFSGWVNDRY